MSVYKITPPSELAVDLAEMRLHCSIEADDTSRDTLLQRYIKTFSAKFEDDTKCSLMEQTLEERLDEWPSGGDIELSPAPVRSIVSVTYVDLDGITQTLPGDAYLLDGTGSDNVKTWWLLPAYGTTWPEAKLVANSIRITMVCGLATSAADVPDHIVSSILLASAFCLRQRESMDVDGRIKELPNRFHAGLTDGYIRYNAK